MPIGAVTYDTDGIIQFTWQPSTGEVAHYNVYAAVDDQGALNKIGTTALPEYALTSDAGHTYWLQVEAEDALGNVGPRSDLSDAVLYPTPTLPPPVTPPSLGISVVSGDTLQLSTDVAGSYELFCTSDIRQLQDLSSLTGIVVDSGTGPLAWDHQIGYWPRYQPGFQQEWYTACAVDAAGTRSAPSPVMGFLRLELATGLNLINVPFTQATALPALLASVPDNSVILYMDQQGQWQVLSSGASQLPQADSFIVNSPSPASLALAGEFVPSSDYVLNKGLNVLGVRPDAPTMTSANILAQVSEMTFLARYAVEQQQWILSLRWPNGLTGGSDFPILTGEAYLAEMTSAATWNPSATQASPTLPSDLPVATRQMLPMAHNIGDVFVGNLSSRSATIAWLTDGSGTSAVRYQAVGQDARAFADEMSMSSTHWVVLNDLEPNTTYGCSVSTGQTAQRSFTFTTPAHQALKGIPILPRVAYGQILMPDGRTPASGVIVRTQTDQLAQTNSRGEWYLTLPAGETEVRLSVDGGLTGSLEAASFRLTSDSPNWLGEWVLDQRPSLALRGMVPQQVQLAPAYPNPANPSTWIPYSLPVASPVRVHIHNIRGERVRTLDLGWQSAGNYLGSNDAAHWDGRTELGHKVSSGIYFYTLHAGDVKHTRKLVIRK